MFDAMPLLDAARQIAPATPVVTSSRVAELRAATPFLLLERQTIAARVEAFRAGLPGVRPYYAVKCNSESAILQLMHEQGVGFEVASLAELRMLVSLGVEASCVLFSNTVKIPGHIEQSRALGLRRFAFDSADELRKLASLAPKSEVYARVAVEDSGSLFPLARKFGAPPKEVIGLMALARDLGLRPMGLTFHVGSQCADPTMYTRAIRQCGVLMTQLLKVGIEISMLDIGGGMPARYADPVPDIAQIGDAVARGLRGLPYQPIELVAEPGRYLVAEAGVLVTSIIGAARRSGENWLFLDVGGFNGLMEAVQTGGRWRFPISSSRDRERPQMGAKSAFYTLTGPSCDSGDTMFYRVELREALATGDQLYIGAAGAYTLSYASSFNGFPPPRAIFV